MKHNYLFDKDRSAIYQEDLLIEISERLQVELDSANLSPDELANILGIEDEYYIDGILEGFENIKVRELANIFSIFNKVLAIVPLAESERVQIHKSNDHIIHYNYSYCHPNQNLKIVDGGGEFVISRKVKNHNFEDVIQVHIEGNKTQEFLETSNFEIESNNATLFNYLIGKGELCHLK